MDVDVDQFNRDVATICEYAGETPENRDAAAFLLACVYCNKPRQIAQLARLPRELTRYYLDNVAKYIVDEQYGFLCQWPDEKLGPMSFILDMLVVQGKITRQWNDSRQEFIYQAIPEDKRTQPKRVGWKRKPKPQPSPDKHVVEVKLSARREGLVPIKR